MELNTFPQCNQVDISSAYKCSEMLHLPYPWLVWHILELVCEPSIIFQSLIKSLYGAITCLELALLL